MKFDVGDLIKYDNTLGVIHRATENDNVFIVLLNHQSVYTPKILNKNEFELIGKTNQIINQGDAVVTYHGNGIVTCVEDIGKKMYFIQLDNGNEVVEWESTVWKK